MDSDDVFLVDYGALFKDKHLLYPVSILATLLSFFTLYIVADDHLNRSLELLAKRCRMSPAMAGLTLLAFGNGASDFFTAVIGVSESPTMILGSSVGAGLFITCVVLAATVLLARHPHPELEVKLPSSEKRRIAVSKGPFVRSTAVYLGCVVAVLYFGAVAQSIHLGHAVGLLVCFVGYVAAALYSHWRDARDSLPELDGGKPSATSTDKEEPIQAIMASSTVRDIAALYFRDRTRVLRLPIDIPLGLSIPSLCEEDEGATPEERALGRILHHVRGCLFPLGLSILACLFIRLSDIGGPEKLLGYCCALCCGSVLSVIKYLGAGGTCRPGGPCAYRLIGAFLCSLCWIYFVTKELLNALTAIGMASGINEAVLGLTILAWGNSCGDLVSNIALAHNGHAETAIIAALSGPIQNVLLTLGACFTIACLRSPDRRVRLDAPDQTFLLTSVFLVACLAALLVAVPLVFGCRLPRYLGMVLLLAYGTYLAISLRLVASSSSASSLLSSLLPSSLAGSAAA